MTIRRVGLVIAAALVLAACNATREEVSSERGTTATSPVVTEQPNDTAATEPATAATDEPPGDTTATEPPPDEPDESCVVTVAPGGSLSAIAAGADGVTLDALVEENRIGLDTVILPGDELDVCIGNDVDDVTGASRLPPQPRDVQRQQAQLNGLFAPYVIAELAVDGDFGPLTQQLLCAARLGLGLPASTAPMSAGSPEEEVLFESTALEIPAGAATWADRWILIDKTCQVVVTGERDERVVNVYPTSTGEPGHETRDLQAAAAFRYDPAADNGGWHDSSHFPVAADNPLNGNMYKPLYFNRGQAIHGATYVPPFPNSKGCARLFTWHHDSLIAWLGLDDLTDATWRRGEIGVTVTVQGSYRSVE